MMHAGGLHHDMELVEFAVLAQQVDEFFKAAWLIGKGALHIALSGANGCIKGFFAISIPT